MTIYKIYTSIHMIYSGIKCRKPSNSHPSIQSSRPGVPTQWSMGFSFGGKGTKYLGFTSGCWTLHQRFYQVILVGWSSQKDRPTGWWLTHPSEKWWTNRQFWWWHAQLNMESHKIHVPNHQPALFPGCVDDLSLTQFPGVQRFYMGIVVINCRHHELTSFLGGDNLG